ncbi:MAG: hypothetical protein ACKN9U_20040 [Pirellulaceae bacterium]
MQPQDRQDRQVSEKCLLARLLASDAKVGDDPLEELRGLAKTAGTEVVGFVVQRREHPDQTTYLGKGKVQELKHLVDFWEADVVIFDNDLTPAQTRNLEKAVGCKVLDRTEVILDIFATNARTY